MELAIRKQGVNEVPLIAPDHIRSGRRFYAVITVSMMLGLALNCVGFNVVRILFWAAVLNGVLAPPLILLVVFLTSNRKVMGERVNSATVRLLGWATAIIMTAASVAMIVLWGRI